MYPLNYQYSPLANAWVFHPRVETATGGFKLDTTNLPVRAILPAGSPISYDESTRIAKVIKTATVYANATNNPTVIPVNKGHLFIVGEFMSAILNGAAYPITNINTSNALYDNITLGGTLGLPLRMGSGLFQAAAETTNASIEFAPISGLLSDDVFISTNNTIVDVVVRGTVYARRIPALINGLKAKLPLIKFLDSF